LGTSSINLAKSDKVNKEKTVTDKRQIPYIKFFAPISSESIAALMQVIDRKLKQDVKKIVLLISSPGGDVFNGLSAFNFLKGIPLEITTHNFGSIDSVGMILFCAGSNRYSVPHARFLLHGVQQKFRQSASLGERQLEEKIKGLQIDMSIISRVIGDTVKKKKEIVMEDLLKRTTLDAEEAVKYGLVTKIESKLIEPKSEMISIQITPR